jgi:hypothetical protein
MTRPGAHERGWAHLSKLRKTKTKEQLSAERARLAKMVINPFGLSQKRVLVKNYGLIRSDRDPRLESIRSNTPQRLVLHWKAADKFHEMIDAAKEDGIELAVSSAHRGVKGTYETWLAWAKTKYTKPDGSFDMRAARKAKAPPGKSPHHTGLVVDFGQGILNPTTLLKEFQVQTNEYAWLAENAGKHGFTPYLAEPWHWECSVVTLEEWKHTRQEIEDRGAKTFINITNDLYGGTVGDSEDILPKHKILGGLVENQGTPYNDFDYLTPEERRKGIIAEMFFLTDWQLNLSANAAKEVPKSPQRQTLEGSSNKSKKGNSLDASTNLDPTRRYIASTVDAEFYRRRFRARSVPAVVGAFNPYPVPGFPGLIMNPDRPILGKVESVTHTINVASATAQTAVSLSSPRYWDEGEVWYWIGGRENYDKTPDKNAGTVGSLYRRFPNWHNRHTIATNRSHGQNFSNLDKFYLYTIGVPAIEYQSNHMNSGIKPEHIKNSITSKDPGPMDVNPVTLDILEYNSLIAETHNEGSTGGTFIEGTLAHTIWGGIRPTSELPEITQQTYERSVKYTERYGVNETELLIDFLDNDQIFVNNNLVYVGPTFDTPRVSGSSDVILNPIQDMLLDYIDDLKTRELK